MALGPRYLHRFLPLLRLPLHTEVVALVAAEGATQVTDTHITSHPWYHAMPCHAMPCYNRMVHEQILNNPAMLFPLSPLPHTQTPHHRQCEHGPEGLYMLSRWTHRQRQEDCHAGHSIRSGQVRYSTVSAEGACRHILLHLISSHLIPIHIPQSTARTHSKHTTLTLPYPSRLSFALRLLSPLPLLPSFPLYSMQGCQASARSRPHIRQHERNHLPPAGHSAGCETGRRNGGHRRVRGAKRREEKRREGTRAFLLLL
jgi:hypothetical protein